MSDRRRLRELLVGLMLALASPGTAFAQGEPPLAELRVQAETGDSGAQNDLGSRLMAMNDDSVLAEAREWFRRASESGDPEGMNNYSTMLIMGLGGPADETAGRQLRDAAAARGSVGAHLSIAERYLQGGEGYPRDPARALDHIRAAAESASPSAPHAQWRLAMMHLRGIGTPGDPAEAWRWIERASDSGDVGAMISRAVMLATGEGVAEDDLAARDWYGRAAESRDVQFAHGLRGLGGMLLTGEGGPADVPRGIAYLRIAHAANDDNAGRLLEMWEEQITTEIDAEAWRIANQWMAEHMSGDTG